MSKNLVFNKIPIEDIKIGMEVSYSQTITDADVKDFAGISGDRNPVHMDEEYAEDSRFKKRIAHGLMSASYFSALFGTKLPGEGCVYVSQSLKFKRAVYLGDTVTATVIVKEVDLPKNRVFFRTVCKVKDKIVIDGEAELFVPISFEKKLIINKNELLKYKDDIAELFHASFDAELDMDMWKWAYIDNVCGDPIVSLYFHNEKLVGHYAVIPMKLKYNDKTILAALSMTTMVDAAYRKHGLFIEQANEVNKKAKELGFSLVYGFPNLKSAPGFKKRLGWTIDNKSYVIKIQGKDLVNKSVKSDNQISFNDKDDLLLNWRLSKPNQKYIKNGNLILKEFDDDLDIVFHQNDFEKLEKERYYNILVDDSDDYENKKSFDYVFGYKIFDDKLIDFRFKKDLIISDVF